MAAPLKVFISHSTRDGWVARHIARDLEAIGCPVFLDEKGIQTGASIDSDIRKHLVESDHILVLLSPFSVKSEWVLVELGGALALEKRVIPVLLHVGMNQVPKAISLKLARDINELERYYAELRTPAASIAKPDRSRRGEPIITVAKHKIGDLVRITSKKPRDPDLTGWLEDMDQYLGQTAVVNDIVAAETAFRAYKLDIDDGDWLWIDKWLLPERRKSRRRR